MPDVTFLMELSPEVGKARISEDSQDRLEQEKLEFHDRVFQGYEALADLYSERFVRIDASRDKEAIRRDICAALDRVLEDRGFSCR